MASPAAWPVKAGPHPASSACGRPTFVAEPPRLLLVGWGLGGGGAQRRFRLVAEHVFGGTADIAVLAGTGEPPPHPGQKLHPLGWSGRRSLPGVFRRLREVVRGTAYDAVLAFAPHANALAWAAVRGLSTRRPALVMTEIGCPYTRVRFHGMGRLAILHVLQRLTYPSADMFAANSEDGVAEAVRHYAVDPRRVRRLPNLVDPARLAALAAAAGHADPTPSICAVARLEPQKSLGTLLEAAAGLPAGLAWRIDILGQGSERGRLEALAARLGIAARVRFHGWVENPAPFVRRATATVLPSVLEGFSNAALESLALGTPVVMSLHSTDARMMSEQGAVLGFPVGDHGALRVQLERVLTDAGLRASLSEQGRRCAEFHAIANAVPAYEALVRDAVAARASPRAAGIRRMARPAFAALRPSRPAPRQATQGAPRCD